MKGMNRGPVGWEKYPSYSPWGKQPNSHNFFRRYDTQHTTFSITTFSIMTFSIMALSITTLSITTLSITTLSITTLRIITFIIIVKVNVTVLRVLPEPAFP
jgi:hypothetical protein